MQTFIIARIKAPFGLRSPRNSEELSFAIASLEIWCLFQSAKDTARTSHKKVKPVFFNTSILDIMRIKNKSFIMNNINTKRLNILHK